MLTSLLITLALLPAPAALGPLPAPPTPGLLQAPATVALLPEPATLALLPAPATVAPLSAAAPGGQAQAGPPFPAWPAGTVEIGGLGGYGTGKVYDPQRTPTSVALLAGRVAVHLGPLADGWLRGNVAIVLEGVAMTIDQEPRARGGGLNLLFRYTWAADRWRPSFFAGAGALFTDEPVPPRETERNYMPQTGVGLQYLVGERVAVGGEYRFHHISNNGQTESNPGINSHLLLFGVSWFR
jgi:hypothetical protein